jgi:hypothetical protein
MPEFNRRKFLIASAGVGAVGVVGGVGALTLPDLLRHSQKQLRWRRAAPFSSSSRSTAATTESAP